MPETITRKQILAVAEILQLDPACLTTATISAKEVEVTYLEEPINRGGPIVHRVVTYEIQEA